MVIGSQEDDEVVLFFEYLTHTSIQRYDLTRSHVPKLAHKLFAKGIVFTVGKNEQMKLRLTEFVEDALPVQKKVRQTIAGFDIADSSLVC